MLIIILCVGTLALAQEAKLISEHAALTSDCKAVRGHSHGIVSEASQAELNKDVAVAQAEEVHKSLLSMKKRLETTKKLLTPDQLKTVKGHYEMLEELCADLQVQITAIKKELAKPKPDRIEVRNMAVKLRTQMRDGSAEHNVLKKKLGIR
jgi:hypothetical protein